jgi:hypothetical protein
MHLTFIDESLSRWAAGGGVRDTATHQARARTTGQPVETSSQNQDKNTHHEDGLRQHQDMPKQHQVK